MEKNSTKKSGSAAKTGAAQTAEKAFLVRGTFSNAKGTHAFSKTVLATSEKRASEKTLSTLGSHHRVTRRRISIQSVMVAPAKETL